MSHTSRLVPLWGNFAPGAVVALDFVHGRYRVGGGRYAIGDFSRLPGLTITRASTGYAETSGGVLQLFNAGQARITDQGLLVEQSGTNVVLWNRDLTNAALTKTNVTAALDQTGVDGTANSASSITATAGNGTILQAITLASSARFQSAYVKRITGSGTINMTMDNGATWTAVTVTSAWTRVSIPTQTLANPTVGFQIVTNGDKIAVDFVQNENGTFATSPIATTSASVTRAADAILISGLSITQPVSLFAEGLSASGARGTGDQRLATLEPNSAPGQVGTGRSGVNSSRFSVNDGVTGNSALGVTWANSTAAKIAGRATSSALAMSFNGGSIVTAAQGTSQTLTRLNLAGFLADSTAYWNGYARRVLVYPFAMNDAQLMAITQ